MTCSAEEHCWSVDDILDDPRGYQRFVNARLEEDAELWVEQQVRDIADARQQQQQERQQTFLARMRGSLLGLFTKRR